MLCMQKVWHSTIFFLEVQTEKTKKSGFWAYLSAFVDFFMEIHVKVWIFVPKNWKSRTILQEKVWKSNLYRGGHSFSGIAHGLHVAHSALVVSPIQIGSQ